MTKVTNIQINKLTNINILNNFKEFYFSFDLSKPRSSWKLDKSVGGSIKKLMIRTLLQYITVCQIMSIKLLNCILIYTF